MFTGIIEEIGKIVTPPRGLELLEIEVAAKKITSEVKIGDSLALNGVCLTVTKKRGNSFFLELMPETIKRTSLGKLKTGEKVNLEQALKISGRVGGHFLTGHVDDVGVVAKRTIQNKVLLYKIEAPLKVLTYLIPQGSVGVDGISLTVVEVTGSNFTVSLLPYTAENTTLGFKKEGDTVNLEVDLLGKYVAKFLTSASSLAKPTSSPKKDARITLSFLQEKGFTEVKK